VSAYRHTRQVRLVEIGEAGQARLAHAAVSVRGAGAAGVLEARYLAGAGVGTVRVHDDAQARAVAAMDASVRVERVEPAAPARPLEPTPLDALEGMDPSALDVARGAWRALDTLRRVIVAATADAPDVEAP
jgi:hypothetical protein